MCGCAGKPRPAASPARSTIRAKPPVVNGDPRSDVNTNGDFGSCARFKRRHQQRRRQRIAMLDNLPSRNCLCRAQLALPHCGGVCLRGGAGSGRASPYQRSEASEINLTRKSSAVPRFGSGFDVPPDGRLNCGLGGGARFGFPTILSLRFKSAGYSRHRDRGHDHQHDECDEAKSLVITEAPHRPLA
jgi:hypothetical protein